MKFKYKMTGNSNTLSLSFKTYAGDTTLVWRLHGNHGNMWKNGSLTYQPEEIFAVTKLVFTVFVCLLVCSFVCQFLRFYVLTISDAC